MIKQTENDVKEIDSDHILMVGELRMVMINRCLYLRTLEKIGPIRLLPIDKELLDEVEYSIDNNLPILKEKLYFFYPDLFTLEIRDLPLIE